MVLLVAICMKISLHLAFQVVWQLNHGVAELSGMDVSSPLAKEHLLSILASPKKANPVTSIQTPTHSKIDSVSYDSIVIEELQFPGGHYFKTKYNHAKFALSYPGNTWVCPADINMETTQRKRGGGAVCFQNSNLYALLNGAISKLNTTC